MHSGIHINECHPLKGGMICVAYLCGVFLRGVWVSPARHVAQAFQNGAFGWQKRD